MSGYYIVGFEVVPCSVKRDPAAMSKLNMYDKIDPMDCTLELDESQSIWGQEISVAYEVVFVRIDIGCLLRWDTCLRMEGDRACCYMHFKRHTVSQQENRSSSNLIVLRSFVLVVLDLDAT
ncbi:unnamed protein product [Musa acuminata subsp. burmannicoides]